MGVRFPRPTTNTRVTDDSRGQTRVAGHVDTDNAERGRKRKRKSKAITADVAHLAPTGSNPSEEDADTTPVGGGDGTQSDDDHDTEPIAAFTN